MSEEEIFHQALARQDPEERTAYLQQACGGDAALRASVEALLAGRRRGHRLHGADLRRTWTRPSTCRSANAPAR